MKKALAVHTHFEDFVEDQFDFHTYCMRKVTRFVFCLLDFNHNKSMVVEYWFNFNT